MLIPDTRKLQLLAQDVGQTLIARSYKLATAESCTGGWVAKIITDVNGSSAWYECSLVTYSNQAKHDLLGVETSILQQHGAVSQPVVKAMVLGLLDRCDADLGISISGIAGPGGGSDEKPTGTVWIAWARPGQVIESVRFHFDGDRDAVRRQAVEQAFKGIQRMLDSE